LGGQQEGRRAFPFSKPFVLHDTTYDEVPGQITEASAIPSFYPDRKALLSMSKPFITPPSPITTWLFACA